MEDSRTVNDLLSRIAVIEIKLATVIDKVDDMKHLIDDRYSDYTGNSKSPSIPGRIIALESFSNTCKWMVGVLYAATIGLAVSFIKEKL